MITHIISGVLNFARSAAFYGQTLPALAMTAS